eukprot:scaffold87374_cov26-Tisochrysis_lutea.AAC.3
MIPEPVLGSSAGTEKGDTFLPLSRLSTCRVREWIGIEAERGKRSDGTVAPSVRRGSAPSATSATFRRRASGCWLADTVITVARGARAQVDVSPAFRKCPCRQRQCRG